MFNDYYHGCPHCNGIIKQFIEQKQKEDYEKLSPEKKKISKKLSDMIMIGIEKAARYAESKNSPYLIIGER